MYSGFVNCMNRQVQWERYGGMISEEVEVIGLTQNFATGGDSGSIMMGALRELVGLLIANDSCASDCDLRHSAKHSRANRSLSVPGLARSRGGAKMLEQVVSRLISKIT